MLGDARQAMQRVPRAIAYAVTAAAITMCSVLTAAEGWPGHIQIKETKEERQELPKEVCGVFVQNGKRAWFQLRHPAAL